jgi:hypothetical protein
MTIASKSVATFADGSRAISTLSFMRTSPEISVSALLDH